MSQTITYAENADPATVAKIEAARAKLKPCCMRCRRTLTKREIESRLCANRRECTVRAITRKPNFAKLYTLPPRTLRRDY